MSSAIEALGMSLPASSSTPAENDGKQAETQRVGKAIRLLLERDIKPRDIMTKKAFENAFNFMLSSSFVSSSFFVFALWRGGCCSRYTHFESVSGVSTKVQSFFGIGTLAGRGHV